MPRISEFSCELPQFLQFHNILVGLCVYFTFVQKQ